MNKAASFRSKYYRNSNKCLEKYYVSEFSKLSIELIYRKVGLTLTEGIPF